MRRGAIGKLTQVTIYLVICGVLAFFVIAETSHLRLESSRSYNAVFQDVSALKVSEDVRIAGIAVGTVKKIDIEPDNLVDVNFTVKADLPVDVGSQAVIRYKNLVGDRFLELTPGPDRTRQMPENGTIPVSQTTPALDLDELYNGFSPLFEGLQPQQVNDLTGSLIQVLQGQGNAVDGLLGRVGSLTNGLADKDAVIGEVIDNLNVVLGTVNGRRSQVTTLVDQLQQLVSGLAQQRGELGNALTNINSVADTARSLVTDARPTIKGNVAQILRLSQAINRQGAGLNMLFQKAPGYYQILGRLGANQSAFQFYLCGAQLRITPVAGGPSVLSDVVASQEARCRF